jgi:uncharacterized membrane protein YidH (DUF202 family)
MRSEKEVIMTGIKIIKFIVAMGLLHLAMTTIRFLNSIKDEESNQDKEYAQFMFTLFYLIIPFIAAILLILF